MEAVIHGQARRVLETTFFGYKDLYGGFEELWTSWAGSAEEPEIPQRHGQGCIEPSRGFEDPRVPLLAPSGVQLAPRSPELVDGELVELFRLMRVLRRSA